ncbi:serine/threonine-protein kinase [Sinomonas gamaensis]|uniref:serine/threonine-protein kinase n=1 Tax=Sinomonas gamaensis TaxID=2565624 RepID=UPI001487272D|nr:serine/threonine-protein kinase [Sinomonas gamaensis]
MPGYDVVRLLGRGGAGDVWLLRARSSGRLAAGKIVRDQQGRLAARKEARRLSSHRHPHVVDFLGSVPLPDGGGVVLLMDYAAGGSLARLVSARGRLSVGETVTTIAPIAQALAALHLNGTSHLDVSPGNVLFVAEGKPLLADLGAARTVGEERAPRAETAGFADPAADDSSHIAGPASDVYALGALAWFCLTGTAPEQGIRRPPLTLVAPTVPRSLATAVAAALDEEPRLRPTAAEFARAVLRSARPEPVDLAPAVEPEVLPHLVTRIREDSRSRRPRLPFSLAVPGRLWTRARVKRVQFALAGLLALSAVVVILGGVLPGAWQSSREQAAPQPASGGWMSVPDALRRRAESPDPVQAVQALAVIRAQAFSTGDRDLLRRVNVRGSSAESSDEAVMDRLASEGKTLDGFSTSVLTAELLTPSDPAASEAVVHVRVVTSGFAVHGPDGRELSAPGGGTDQSLRIALGRSGGQWRVVQILSG